MQQVAYGRTLCGMEASAASPPTGRERILVAAYDLFTRHGVRGVGVDTIIDKAGVAKATLYRNFASKDALVLAVLDRREKLWTNQWLRAEVELRATTPAERLLTIFDVFGEWFATDGFEGCTFVNMMLEIDDREESIRVESVAQLARIREFLSELVTAAGIDDVETVTWQWHILMKGSIVAAGEGDSQAAARAQELGLLLLEHHGVAP